MARPGGNRAQENDRASARRSLAPLFGLIGGLLTQISRWYLEQACGGGSEMNRPVTLQEILQAKITSLEEMVGQLKGLSELKRSIADDAENSPEHPERFRQKAMEHKRDAFAAL